MKSLLVINSSAAREGSVSRTLVEETVARLLEANPFAEVVRRDLGVTPVPHLSIETLAGVLIGPYSPGFVGDIEVAQQLAEVGVK